MLLSILIPCYNNPSGLSNILGPLTGLKESTLSELEIIVSDDSPSPLLSRNQLASIKHAIPFFRYLWNSPPLGAVDNWNHLLSIAKGNYLWLCHHDEYLFDAISNIDILIRTISSMCSDVYILPLLKVYSVGIFKFVQCHTPPRIILSLFTKFPLLFYQINPLGPPSILIVKSTVYATYDNNLRWLVDVDYYFRVFSRVGITKCFVRAPLYVVSDQKTAGSISKDLSDRLREITTAENYYLESIGRPVAQTLYFSLLLKPLLLLLRSVSTLFVGFTSFCE
jgi:glycosyltransferase involved in cell wall biosynthesis